jgi:hypothetical protein
MSGKDNDKNLVDLKDWKKQKARTEREKTRASGNGNGGPVNMSSPRVQKVVLAVFILFILWLAMPKDFIATIRQSIGL